MTGYSLYRVGSWTNTGLANYSGSASYEKDFELPPEFKGKRIYLDCGEVGVTAEVWVNEQRVGERVWKPFRFDITREARIGTNRLRIEVSNTEANARAVANHRQLLDNIELNGLLGPVRILPYVELSIKVKQN